MTLRTMAKILGISPAYLSLLVNGKRKWRGDLKERYETLVNRGASGNSWVGNNQSTNQAYHRNNGGAGEDRTPYLFNGKAMLLNSLSLASWREFL